MRLPQLEGENHKQRDRQHEKNCNDPIPSRLSFFWLIH